MITSKCLFSATCAAWVLLFAARVLPARTGEVGHPRHSQPSSGPLALTGGRSVHNDGYVALLAADISKTVLRAIAEAAPEAGPGVVTGVSIRHGWGDIVFVEVAVGRERHTGRPFDREEVSTFCSRVQDALGPERHKVSVIESLL